MNLWIDRLAPASAIIVSGKMNLSIKRSFPKATYDKIKDQIVVKEK
jgi:hypothetical protein